MVRETPALEGSALLICCTELSIRPDLNQQLVPQHTRAALRAQGLDIDSDFQPMNPEDMLARLD
jgi:glycogen synthase kinase 3 beta